GAVLIGVAVAANWMGVRVSARLQLGLASCLAALLAVAIATSIPHAHLANLRPFAPKGWLAVGSAATLLVWSFAGWETVTHLAAVVAVVVSLGTINAYLAAGSKLGAALGRDGGLPPWLARGSDAGGIPRRSLGVIAAMLALVLIVQLATRLDVNLMVRATTSC